MQNQEKQARRKRIEEEVLLDVYGEYEEQVAWYTYFSNNLSFPFRAQIMRRRRDSCELLQEVEVLGLKNAATAEPLVEAVAPGEEFTFFIPLEDLKNIQADDETYEAVEDWKYWKRNW